jgi:hypothetical protein
MVEPTLGFIAEQLRRVLVAQQSTRDDLTIVQHELILLKQELTIVRGEVRLVRSAIARVEDMLTMNVLERIQKLEAREVT